MPRDPLLTILYDDDDGVAIDKPAGLAIIPGRGESDSALERLGRQLHLPVTGAADPRLRVVHRLDKETSGVVLFAKHAAAQRHLSHQFMRRTVAKEYLAIVSGVPQGNEGHIEAPLARHPVDPRRMAVVKHGGRPALTAWKVEQRFRIGALLRVFPKTGKTHQIRVHLAHIGLPLLIDPLYHPPARGLLLSQFKRGYRTSSHGPERPLIDRLTLHAEKLTVTGLNGQPLVLSAEPPKDFRAAVNMLGKYA